MGERILFFFVYFLLTLAIIFHALYIIKIYIQIINQRTYSFPKKKPNSIPSPNRNTSKNKRLNPSLDLAKSSNSSLTEPKHKKQYTSNNQTRHQILCLIILQYTIANNIRNQRQETKQSKR